MPIKLACLARPSGVAATIHSKTHTKGQCLYLAFGGLKPGKAGVGHQCPPVPMFKEHPLLCVVCTCMACIGGQPPQHLIGPHSTQSTPTVLKHKPKSPEISPLPTEPKETDAIAERPRRAMRKYSAGPNHRETRARGGDQKSGRQKVMPAYSPILYFPLLLILSSFSLPSPSRSARPTTH